MGDTGDDFNAWDEEKKAKKAANRKSSPEILKARNIEFEEKNAGAHLIVKVADGKTADFWPGTGLFIIRGGGRRGRGVFNLLKHC